MISSLVAAALWALAVVLFRDPIRRHGPAGVNFFKCTLAAVCFWAFIALVRPISSDAATGAWTLVALSGVVGMSLGDLLLFIAVREGGVQRALVLFNSSPLLTALVAIPVYGELPTLPAWIGIVLILVGVSAVETDPYRLRGSTPTEPSRPWLAALAGTGAAAGQAAGILMARGPLQQIGVVPATAVRITTAAVALGLLLVASRGGRRTLAGLARGPWRQLAAASLIGTVLGLYFMMRGIQEVPAGIAAALIATSPIFSLPIARFVLHEPLGPRALLGTLVAVAGVVLIQLPVEQLVELLGAVAKD
jgi:drug/metabolite transporter (DMT)-like permease